MYASDRYTGTVDISAAFIKSNRYFQNLMSVLWFFHHELDLKILSFLQSPQAQLMNNFVSGAIGGFAGTALNTP